MQPLSGFKRRYRKAKGIKKLKRRLNIERIVAARIPRLSATIEKQLRLVE